jgi:hypothetical protein
MPNSPISHTTRRPADNELYDRGCDLVEAAIEIRQLADDPAAARAVPALLGCVEAALHELGCAVVSLDETSGYAVRTDTMADRMRRGFMNLGLALADAEFASTAARGLAARSIAAASGSRAAGSHRLRSLDAGSDHAVKSSTRDRGRRVRLLRAHEHECGAGLWPPRRR